MATKKVKKMAFGGLNRMARPMANQTSVNALTVDPRTVIRPANYPAGNMASGLETLRKFAAANNMGSGNRTAQTSATTTGDMGGGMAPQVGRSPLDGFKNLPKMSGPLGAVQPGQSLNAGQVAPRRFGSAIGIGSRTGIGAGQGASIAGAVNPFTKKVTPIMKKGGAVKVSSASKRADGCAIKGKTKGKLA
jgi:hypothetical protein